MAQKISKVVGIDLGTTNSVISMMGPDNKTIICYTDANKRRTIPSVIVWDKKTNSIKRGHKAFDRRGSKPEPIVSIKRKMGDANYRVKVGERDMSPIEVSAEILMEMKEKMQDYLITQPGCENYIIDRAIVTIPANFGAEQSENTTKAGELAGLQIVKTLQEPSSSSAYYCWKNEIQDGIFMVYDLGGGTFDVSIVRYDNGTADVVSISGHNYIGGDTFDDVLAKHLAEVLSEDYTLDLDFCNENDMLRFTKLKLAAEIIKKSLSTQDECYYTHDGLMLDQEGLQVNLAVTVTRDEFESLIKPALKGTLEKCSIALEKAEKAGVTLDMIEGVLLVGGSTHIPYVKEFVRQNFCDPSLPLHTIQPEPLYDEPDMAVGFGAAVSASIGYSEITFSEAETTAPGVEPAVYSIETNPAVGVPPKSTVTGILREMSGKKLPANIKASVSKADGSYSSTFDIGADGSFRFTALPAPGDNEPFICEITSDGVILATSNFNAAISDITPPPTTLSHTIFVKKVDGSLSPLMEEGTNLPASKTHVFKTSSQYSAKVVIFEDNTHLCDIQLTFENPIPENSPVEIILQIDEKSTKHVTASAGGDTQYAVIEPPVIKPLDPFEIKEKMSDFNAMLSVASPQKQIEGKALKHGKLQQLADEAEQAAAENDTVRARETYDELSKRINDFAAEIGDLNPTESVLSALAERCLALIREHHDSDSGSISKVNEYKNIAAECYACHDQQGLTKVYNDLQSLEDYLKPGPDPEGTITPPKWMYIDFMTQQIEENMHKADENTCLQRALNIRKKSEAERPDDVKYMNECKSAVGPWTTDEDAVPYLIKLRTINERWESYACYDDIIK